MSLLPVRSRITSTTHATIVPASPARLARLALWDSGGEPSGDDPVELVVPTDDGMQRRSVMARLVSVADVLDELIVIGPGVDATSSVHAWSAIAKTVLGLIARGRLQAAITAEGIDQWTVGPLSESDRATRAAFVDALPPSAHCLALGESVPLQMLSADRAIVAFYQAVADAMPRTAAAPLVVGQREWASLDPVDVSRLRAQVAASDSAERTLVGVRLRRPASDQTPFVAELQIRSAVDPQIVASASDLWRGSVAWFDQHVETDLLRAVRRGSAIWSPLRRLLDQAEPASLELLDDEAMALLGEVAVELATVGIEVLVPAVMTRALGATAHAVAPPGAEDGPAMFDVASILELRWRPTIDGEPVSDEELAILADARRPLVRLRGDWVVVDPTIVARLGRSDHVSAAAALTAALGGQLLLDDELVDVQVAGSIAQLAGRLRALADTAAISGAGATELVDPVDLLTELRPYQRRGVEWMEGLDRLGFGGVLADDMGLGKTVQIIALLLRRRADGEQAPTLVVCPASVGSNWLRELERFAPTLATRSFIGADRSLAGLGPGEVVITTYGLARRDSELLAGREWGVVVADEAQHIKNPNSATARAMRRIPATMRLALTGTPVENRLTELWSLVDWTTPGLLGPVDEFRRRVSIPIERDRDPEVTARFNRMIAPFLLRRHKTDPLIAPELPPKTETEHVVLLTAEQAGLYRAAADEILGGIGRSEGIARRGLVFKLLTELKQICNHPAHYLGQPGPLPGRSGKLDAFIELVDAIVDAGDSTLVFTQYVEMGKLLVSQLASMGIGAEFLHGSVPLGQRAAMVDRFQAGRFPVFVISLKAGGLGLNLTKATHVIHYDRWWNPAVENQASDRAWRIGQDRPVQVHQLIAEGTLEERIAAVLAAKQELADAVVGSGDSWISRLGDEDLAELVSLVEAH